MLVYLIKRTIFFILHIFWILPIKKNQIYFESFLGRQISCNPLYIYQFLCKKYTGLKYVWCYNEKTPQEFLDNKNIIFVKYHSFNWIIANIRSKIIVNNMAMPIYFPFRTKQIFISTWHGGGAYKKASLKHHQFGPDKWNKLIVKQLKISPKRYKFISSSNKFTQVMKEAYLLSDENFMPIGMPRNDIFFHQKIYNKVRLHTRKKLNIAEDAFFILYAPTYRGRPDKASFIQGAPLELEKIKKTIKIKFKKNVIFGFRCHHELLKNFTHTVPEMINISTYPNMQDLLCAADMLITDYSSSIWDFSFTGNPCILYTPDIDIYKHERGFFTDPYTWGFPIAKTTDELCLIIKNFDHNDFTKNMENHHKDFESFEMGNATRQICDFIISQIK